MVSSPISLKHRGMMPSIQSYIEKQAFSFAVISFTGEMIFALLERQFGSGERSGTIQAGGILKNSPQRLSGSYVKSKRYRYFLSVVLPISATNPKNSSFITYK